MTLTTEQKDLLMFIHGRLKETGKPPTFEEIRVGLGLKSKSGIHRMITSLEEHGFVRRLPHKARSLEILRLPDATPQQSEPSNVVRFPVCMSVNGRPCFGGRVYEDVQAVMDSLSPRDWRWIKGWQAKNADWLASKTNQHRNEGATSGGNAA